MKAFIWQEKNLSHWSSLRCRSLWTEMSLNYPMEMNINIEILNIGEVVNKKYLLGINDGI